MINRTHFEIMASGLFSHLLAKEHFSAIMTQASDDLVVIEIDRHFYVGNRGIFSVHISRENLDLVIRFKDNLDMDTVILRTMIELVSTRDLRNVVDEIQKRLANSLS